MNDENLIELKDWNEKAPTRGQLRGWLKTNKPGLADCFSRIGSLVLVDKEKVFAWIKEQKYTPIVKRGAGRQRKPKGVIL